MNCPRRHICWQSKRLLGRDTQAETSRVREPRRTAVTWLTVSGFIVMGLVSESSLANWSNSESFLVVCALFNQDGCQQKGLWNVVGHVVSPFDLSRTLPVGGGLLVPCSLPGPPVIKELLQMVTMVPGPGGGFWSVCFPEHDQILKYLAVYILRIVYCSLYDVCRSV